MIKEKAVGVILYYMEKNHPRFLLLKYKRWQTHWDFVKGHVEKGEKTEDAAKREVFEETNLKNIKLIPKFKETIEYSYHKHHKNKKSKKVRKKVVYFLAEVPKEKSRNVKLSEEHQKFKWTSYNQAKKLLKFPQQQKLLDKVNSFITQNKR